MSAKTAKNVHLNHLPLKDLKLAIVNFCSVTNKHPHLEAFLVSNNADLLIGTESYLDKSCSSSGIFPTNL